MEFVVVQRNAGRFANPNSAHVVFVNNTNVDTEQSVTGSPDTEF